MSTQDTESTPSKPIIRLGLAVSCGVVAMALLFVREQQVLLEQSGGERVPILVASTELHAGERVTPESLGVQGIPKAYVHVNAVPSDAQSRVIGRKVYRTIRQNQPLLWSEFDAPERERINETLAKGSRLTPITIGDHLAKSRFLSPGDFIDVLVHFNFGGERGSVTTTLLQHIQVLEIIQNVAMIALTPEQLEQLVFARSHGSLTFAVRNREDIEKPELPSATFLTLLGNLSGVPAPAAVSTTISPQTNRGQPQQQPANQNQQRSSAASEPKSSSSKDKSSSRSSGH